MGRNAVRKTSKTKKSRTYRFRSWLILSFVLIGSLFFSLYRYNQQPKHIRVLQIPGTIFDYLIAEPSTINEICGGTGNCGFDETINKAVKAPQQMAVSMSDTLRDINAKIEIAAKDAVKEGKEKIPKGSSEKEQVERVVQEMTTNLQSNTSGVTFKDLVTEYEPDGKVKTSEASKLTDAKLKEIATTISKEVLTLTENGGSPNIAQQSGSVSTGNTCQTTAFSVYEGETVIGNVAGDKSGNEIRGCHDGNWILVCTDKDPTITSQGQAAGFTSCGVSVTPIYLQKEQGKGPNCYTDGGAIVVGNGSVVDGDDGNGIQCRGSKDLVPVTNYNGVWLTEAEIKEKKDKEVAKTNAETDVFAQKEAVRAAEAVARSVGYVDTSKTYKDNAACLEAIKGKTGYQCQHMPIGSDYYVSRIGVTLQACPMPDGGTQLVDTKKGCAAIPGSVAATAIQNVKNPNGTLTGGEPTDDLKNCRFGGAPATGEDNLSLGFVCNDYSGKAPVIAPPNSNSGSVPGSGQSTPEDVVYNITSCDDKDDCNRRCGGLYVEASVQMPGDSREQDHFFCGGQAEVLTYLNSVSESTVKSTDLKANTPVAYIENIENAGKKCATTITSGNKDDKKCSEFCPDFDGDGYGEGISLGSYGYVCGSPGQNGDPAPRTLPPGSDCSEASDDACTSGACKKGVNPTTGVKGEYCTAETNLNSQNAFKPDGTYGKGNGGLCFGQNSMCASGYCEINPTVFRPDRCGDNPFVSASSVNTNRTNAQQQIENNQEKYKLIIAEDPKAFAGYEMSLSECESKYEGNTTNVDCIPVPGKKDRYVVREVINDLANDLEVSLKKPVNTTVTDIKDCESGVAADLGAQNGGLNFKCMPESFCPEQDLEKGVLCDARGKPICAGGDAWSPGIDCSTMGYGFNTTADPAAANPGAVALVNQPVLLVPSTFEVAMQNGNMSIMPGARGTTIQTAGCGPLSVYNYLVATQTIQPSDAALNKVLADFSPYWNCKPGDTACYSSLDGVAATLKRYGINPGPVHTDTSILLNYTGMLTFGGKVTGPDASIPHLTTLKCDAGSCCMMDSAYGGGTCNSCNVIDSNNIKCGGYNYHVGNDTGGNPDALQEFTDS